MSSMYAQTAVVSSAAASTPFKVKAPASLGTFGPGYLPPSLLASVSAGAVLTYNIEVSGDNTNWVSFDNATGQAGQFAGTLGAAVVWVRANVTAYTSGSLNFQFIQMVE